MRWGRAAVAAVAVSAELCSGDGGARVQPEAGSATGVDGAYRAAGGTVFRGAVAEPAAAPAARFAGGFQAAQPVRGCRGWRACLSREYGAQPDPRGDSPAPRAAERR